MAAEAGVGRGRIRLYHKHTLIMQLPHSQFIPSSILFRLKSDIKNVMRHMFSKYIYQSRSHRDTIVTRDSYQNASMRINSYQIAVKYRDNRSYRIGIGVLIVIILSEGN